MSVPTGLEDLLGEYLLDARERVARIEQLLLDLEGAPAGVRSETRARLKAELHTLKGNSGMMGLGDLQQKAHAMEDAVNADPGGDFFVATGLLAALDDVRADLSTISGSPAAPAAIDGEALGAGGDRPVGGVRVPFATLDRMMDLIGEMVIQRNTVHNALVSYRASQRDDMLPAGTRTALGVVDTAYESLARILDRLQEQVTGLRLTPLATLFGAVRRIVHDEAKRVGKSARLLTDGGEAPLDKALLELASDVLGHLVRNAVIHGLEPAGARHAAGKPAVGTVRVAAQLRGGEVIIAVSDDGAGIDAGNLARAAAARGFRTSPEQPYGVLFEPGFTTRDRADIGAGRGVGLAAVREAVLARGGEVQVRSTPGAGTTFELHLPLSVSIVRALLLQADGEVYAVPLAAVVETRRLAAGDRHQVNQAGVMVWRDQTVSLLDLGAQFGTRRGGRVDGYAVVIEAAGAHRGLVADQVLGLQEVVLKGLDPIVGRPAGVSGSTILGDGRPILMLDPRVLLKLAPAREAA
jgi:two-component system chemotaxis sensor kinase CheA